MSVKSQQELYEVFVTELGNQAPSLSDLNEGSNIDVLAGVVSVAVSELQALNQEQFRKTFFDTAHGPEVTGGPDDLQTLALDHFGDAFTRPGATKAIGTVLFSRPNTDKGVVVIEAGTVVKTEKTATGNSVSFSTVSEVEMDGLTIQASVNADEAGPSGNVSPGTIKVIETALTDSSITVTNPLSLSGGKSAENDAEYRATIRYLLETLKGATLQSLEAKAKTIAGVVYCRAIEKIQNVIEWDIALQEPIGEHFGLPRAILYISDINGNASFLMIENVKKAIEEVRAAGVRVDVFGAVPIAFDWEAEITLNPLGVNYGVLQTSLSLIKEEMVKYIQDRPVGAAFVRADAKSYIMGKFGPTGTNDLSTFDNLVPTADVAFAANQKMVVGEVKVNGN